jgi:hypothetical protein
MTPKRPNPFGHRGAWLAAALWGSASLTGAQAQAPDPTPLDTAEAPPIPAYGVRPEKPEKRPVSDTSPYQGLWLSRPPFGGPPDTTPPTWQLAITGDQLWMRDPAAGDLGERGKIKFLWEMDEGMSRRLRVSLTERVLNGAPAPDVEEIWEVSLSTGSVEGFSRAGVYFIRGPAEAAAPAYGIPPDVLIPKPNPTPKPVYGLPPSPRIKPERTPPTPPAPLYGVPPEY